MTTRRDLFKDPRVREALAYAFDFQWTNKTVYYGQYEQPASFFAPTELACSGLPQGAELEILERYRGRAPEEVFTTPYVPPQTDGSGWPRENLQIGRAHDCTPVTNAPHVCPLLLAKKTVYS